VAAGPKGDAEGGSTERGVVASLRVLWALVLHRVRWLLVLVAASSFLGGLAEAAVVGVVVNAGTQLADPSGELSGNLPIFGGLSWSVGGAVAVGFGLLAARLAFHLVTAHLTARITTDAMLATRERLHRGFLRAGWDLQSREPEGHLQDLVVSHAASVGTAVSITSGGLAALATLGALLLAAVVVDPKSAVAIIGAVLVMYWFFRPTGRRTRRYTQALVEANRAYVQAVAQSVRLAQEIVTNDVVDEVADQNDRLAEAHAASYFRRQRLSAAVGPMYQSLALAALLGALGVINLLDRGNIAALGAIVLILLRALNSGQQIQSVYHGLNEGVPFALGVQRRLDDFAASIDPDGDRDLGPIERIAMEGVGFAYVPGLPVLSDVTFSVERGEAIGIIGPSGGGKTTLMQLLLRLRRPDRGAFLVNGQPAESFRRSDWYQRVTYVPQEPRLVAGSVAENIAFHRPGITSTAIEEAARQAHIHQDVVSWPDGYDTVTGGQATSFSGGQRQRICIARALVTRPEVVILDEPTSALDVDGETIVQETLAALRGSTTIFIVAHRLSTLRMCDKLMVIEDGRIVAFEPASALAEREGFYQRALKSAQLK